MKIFKRVILIIGIVLWLTMVAIPSWFIYLVRFEKTEECRYSSPDAKYDVIFYEIGSASWPFGPVRAQLQLVDQKEKAVTDREFYVYNDGGGISEENVVSVVWLETRVEVTIRHFDHAPTTTYWLPFPVD